MGLTLTIVSCNEHEGVYIDGTLTQCASGSAGVDFHAVLEELALLGEPIVEIDFVDLDEDWGNSITRLPEELEEVERATQDVSYP